MYGNKPVCWKPELEGFDRLRLISNYLTRMCFCNENGELELETKGTAAASPDGYAPWYSFKANRIKQPRIVFGHWALLQGKADSSSVFALDTGCVWGGSLTAMRLEDETIYSVRSPGYA